MPVTVVRKDGKYRVVEAATGKVAKNAAGTAIDGGGHAMRANAVKQVRAINRSKK